MTLVACLLFGSQYIAPLSEQQCNAMRSNSTDDEDVEAVSSDIEHNANIVFHFAQFVFYLGWVTVAKIMLNPFGEDPGEFMLLEDLLLFLNFFRLPQVPQPLNINPYR